MKILIFTSVFPYPLNEGGKVAQFSILKYLSLQCEVVLVCELNSPLLEEHSKELKKEIPTLEVILIAAETVKKPEGFIIHLLDIVTKIQWRLKKRVAAKDVLKITDNNYFVFPTRPRKVEIVEQFISIVSKRNPDIIQIDFIDNADLVNVIPSHISKVLVHHDLRFTSVLQACLLEKQSSTFSKYLTDYVKTIEISFLNKFNGIVTFSEDDKTKLVSSVNGVKIEAIPFAVINKNLSEITSESYIISKLIFIGPDHHIPNLDAITWYVEEMAEMIWKQLKIKLIVIGNWSLKNKEKLANPGVEFAGFVEDIKSFTNNAVMVVPLRIGSGIRTKILEAFAFGIPVISTTIGSEGIKVENNNQIIIADTEEEFFNAIEGLIKNEIKTYALRVSANQFVRNNFSQEKIGERRIRFYDEILSSDKSNSKLVKAR